MLDTLIHEYEQQHRMLWLSISGTEEWQRLKMLEGALEALYRLRQPDTRKEDDHGELRHERYESE